MADFPWEAVIGPLVRERNVVPVIGQELLSVEREGKRLTFPQLLAQRLAGKRGLTLPPQASLSDVVAELRARRVSTVQIGASVTATARELTAEWQAGLPEPLRLLAEIDDFPLFVSTTPDDLLLEALRGRGRTPRALPYNLMDRPPVLQAGWEDVAPFVVQMFGSFSQGGFASTDEELVEFVFSLQTDRQPETIFDELQRRHLLFIGTAFPDWLMRLFMRALRRSRFAAESDRVRALADAQIGGGQASSLVSFLTNFSSDTVVYDEADAAAFVRELHRRWQEEKGRTAAAPAPGTSAGITRGAIFISYSRQGDQGAAERVYQRFGERKLPAWFDRNALEGGAAWRTEIEDGIRRCRLFVPVLSRRSIARTDGFFIQEWTWALQRWATVKNRPFVVPLVVDDVPDEEVRQDQIARRFLEAQVERAAGGALSDAQLERFVTLLRETQAS